MADPTALRVLAAKLRTRAVDLNRIANEEDNHPPIPPIGDDMTPEQLGLIKNTDPNAPDVDEWGVELLETLDFKNNVATYKWYRFDQALKFTHQELKMRRLREQL